MAGLAFLCLILPLLLGPAAESLISEGVEFEKISFAVTAPGDDPLPALLEKYMGNMRDISEYCSFHAMSPEQADEALRRGDVTAVLSLPENFVQGVMNGTNPDVELIVPEDKPLQSTLTLWLGQSAADLLSAVQAGIYAVLEQYDQFGADGRDFSQVVADINIRYVNWTMERGQLFKTQQLSATGSIPVDKHYSLSLLAFLALSLAPYFAGLYESSRLDFCRRLRSAGRETLLCYASDIAASALLISALLMLPLFFICGGSLWKVLAVSFAMGLFCALFSSFCCLAGNGPGCALLSLSVSTLSWLLAGGLVPPALLPLSLRNLGAYTPVGWLRELGASCLEVQSEPDSALWAMAICGLLLCLLSARLYCRRAARGEVPE